tara:strand:+ start:349 stop:477 length:129 start_codon:yes stop_codon:yes gene_type:complete
MEKSNSSYKFIDRQSGKMGHQNGTHGHFYRYPILNKRRTFIE